MSIDMSGLCHTISRKLSSVQVEISGADRYILLANVLPWPLLAEVANKHRAENININNGRPMNIRLHLGIFIAQSMNNWTDRGSEDMVRSHAGIRVLCGIEHTSATIDHSSISTFRNSLGKHGSEELNRILINYATLKGFTGSEICSSDTTVQEAPIAHPTEVGHLKNIGEKLLGLGTKIRVGLKTSLTKIYSKAMDFFTQIRLFHRGKTEKAVEEKKTLSERMHREITKMHNAVTQAISKRKDKAQKEYAEQLDLYSTILKQTKQWIKTGFHPKGKLISLWNLTARAITRNKVAHATEFGARWIITRLKNGYIIGKPCKKIGADADTQILEEVLENFLDFSGGEIPEMVVYDRGGDGPANHELLAKTGVKHNCIFRKGIEKMDVGPRIFQKAKSERALSEASIATIKNSKYGFNKPRARSADGCAIKGHMAILGANLSKLVVDINAARIAGIKIK